jgi:hypothetical protein
MQLELWRTGVTGSVVVITAAVAYIVSLLQRMKRDQDARAKANEERDKQRAEVQENVRRLVNSTGVHHEGEYISFGRSLFNSVRRNLAPVLMACMVLMLFYQVFTEPRRRLVAPALLEGK